MNDMATRLLLAMTSSASNPLEADQIIGSSLFEPEVQRAAVELRQELLQARQQREATRIIVDAATLITAARETEETLELVCRRSKILLNSDMAYISLNNLDSQETYIRTTDGVITPEYRNLRMPLGTGILGQAAGGATVTQTNDYSKDPRFPHISSVDEAVRSEGVVSILAATMRVRGENMGALLVADRHQRTYTPYDIDLLTQIAGLAAVALQRSEQINVLKATLIERDKARAEVESQNSLLHSIERLDQAMFDIMRDNKPTTELAQVIGEIIGTPVVILHASDLGGHRVPNAPVISEHVCKDSQTGHSTLATAVSGQRILGALEAHDLLDRESRILFERGTAILTAMILAQERSWTKDMQLQHQTIREIEKNPVQKWKTIVSRLAQYRLKEGAVVRVMAVRTDHPEDTRDNLREILVRRGGISSVHNNLLLIVSPDLTGEESYDRIRIHGEGTAIAEVECLVTPDTLSQSLRTVQHTVRAMEALNITGVVDSRWDLGFIGLAIGNLPAATADMLVHQTLKPVLEYDRKNGSALTLSALEFFECDGHYGETAKKLHIHANTLRQRVRRIEQLLGNDWHIGSRRTDVHLALRLWRVQKTFTDS